MQRLLTHMSCYNLQSQRVIENEVQEDITYSASDFIGSPVFKGPKGFRKPLTNTMY